MPPLRERIGDIALLARHFVRKYGEEFKKPGIQLGADSMRRLISYDWPGNVRELENIITRSVLLAAGPVIQSADLPMSANSSVHNGSFRELKAHFVAQFEQHYLVEMLEAFGGNISRAADAAHKNRRAFWQLMRKHGIRAKGQAQNTLDRNSISC